MKITGAEFMDWYDNHWPSDDYHHDDSAIDLFDDNGSWNLDPLAEYNTADLGDIYEDNCFVESVTDAIRRWRHNSDFEILTIEVPKDRVEELKKHILAAGIQVR